MKNKQAIFLSILFLVFRITSFSQSFDKGNSVAFAGIGYGIYNSTFTTKNTTPNTTSYGKSLSAVYSVGYEYGLLSWLGAGAGFKYDKFIDSASQKQSAYGIHIPVFVNAHFVRTEHVDLSAGLLFGYSYFRINANDQYSSAASGGGTIFDMHITPRFYFGKHIGIAIPLSYNFLSYPTVSLTSSNSANNVSNWASGKFNGFNLGVALCVKF